MLFLPSIRAKLLALFLVAAVVPIALVGILSYFNSLRAVETMVGNRTYRLSRTVGEELDKKLARRINDRILVVNRPVQEFLEAVESGDGDRQATAFGFLDGYMEDLFEDYGTYYNELFFADANGVPLVMCDRSGAVSGTNATPLYVPPAALAPTAPRPSREERLEGLGRSLPSGIEEEVRRSKAFGEAFAKEWDAQTRELARTRDPIRAKALLDSLRSSRQRSLAALLSDRSARALARAKLEAPEDPMDVDDDEEAEWPVRPPLPVPEIVSEQVTQAARRGASLAPDEWLLYFDRSAAQGVLRLVRPVFAVGDANHRLGTLVADLRWDHVFPQHLTNEHFGSLGELAVVSAQNGEILFHTNEDLVGQRLTRADPNLAHVLRAEDGSRGKGPWVKFGKSEKTRLASVHELAKVPWQVVSAAVPREFQKEARQAGLLNLLVASLVLLAAGAVLLVASDRVSRSIHVVTEGANEIAAGNLEHPIVVETHDEIQTLAEAFNSMTASLRENIALKESAARELETLNRSLEDRVRERTQELEALNEILNLANQELKELDRMKTNFLSTVSHEFRTPLTSIKAFAEILLDELDESQQGEIRRFLGIINSESERLGRLIKNLLDMSRIESGRIVWARDVFPVHEAVDAALEGLLPLFGEKGIHVNRNLRAGDVLVEADRDRIQQVITNLCENAVKFSEKGRTLWVSCAPAASDNGHSFVEVGVRDEGVGIPREHLEKIFERFWQVDNTETRAAGGTGLGLAISREIVEHHGGRIWAESERGAGTAIRFTLPIRDGERSANG